jgi:hypothetical protein
MATGGTAHAQKAMFQAPALEVILEFPPHVLGQRPALRGDQVREDRIILRNELV